MKPVKRNYVCGIAHKDITNVGGTPSYNMWRRIIGRCYRESDLIQRPSYISCGVCKEWFTFSNFDKWYNEHFVEGWEIDKDLLSNGLKCYSPEACCFLPRELNAFLSSCVRKRTVKKSPHIGIKNVRDKYVAVLKINGKSTHLGTFETFDEAIKVYNKAKKERFLEHIEKYKDQLEPRVLDALLKFSEKTFG
jgi:hypothetical protein